MKMEWEASQERRQRLDPVFLAAVEMRWSGSVAEKQKATW